MQITDYCKHFAVVARIFAKSSEDGQTKLTPFRFPHETSNCNGKAEHVTYSEAKTVVF